MKRSSLYYYSVFLSDYDIEVKYVPSHQSALYQLDFRAGQPGLLIGATNGELHVEKNKVLVISKSVPMRQECIFIWKRTWFLYKRKKEILS